TPCSCCRFRIVHRVHSESFHRRSARPIGSRICTCRIPPRSRRRHTPRGLGPRCHHRSGGQTRSRVRTPHRLRKAPHRRTLHSLTLRRPHTLLLGTRSCRRPCPSCPDRDHTPHPLQIGRAHV